ncbi:MAG TPA: DUF6252 family protein [Ferruginibacter sp.]|nr:DUF6252 family protein [Ferruginibacter sp.]
MIKNLLGLMVVVSVIAFSACQKELSDPNGTVPVTPTVPGTGTGNFSAKIDGVQWVANNIKTATRQGGVLVLYGSASDKKSMILRVADSGVHNYSLHTTSASNVGAYTDSAISPNSFATNQWGAAGNYGNLNVSSIDTVNKTISGTFNMKVYRQFDNLQRDITGGVFTNIPYSTSPPPLSGTDSFRVKIAGVSFTYNLLIGYSAFGNISVSASQGAAPTVGITVPDNVTPGAYPFDIFTHIGQYNPSSSVFLGADTGTVTILEHNTVTKRIRGNFHFLANTVFTHLPPNVQLTEGYFSVKYN